MWLSRTICRSQAGGVTAETQRIQADIRPEALSRLQKHHQAKQKCPHVAFEKNKTQTPKLPHFPSIESFWPPKIKWILEIPSNPHCSVKLTTVKVFPTKTLCLRNTLVEVLIPQSGDVLSQSPSTWERRERRLPSTVTETQEPLSEF